MLSGLSGPLTASPEIFAFACIAVLAGAIVQGASGVGLGLVAAPVLVFLDPHIGPGPLLVLAMLMSAIMLWREHDGLDRGGLALTLTGRVIGSVLAGYAYLWLSGSWYSLIFGLLILMGVGMSVAGYEVPRTHGRLIFAGACSGVMGTLTSAGSPAIALVYQKGEGAVVRGTLSAFFFFSSFISLLVLFGTGKFTPAQAIGSLSLLPALLVGFWISSHIVARASRNAVRRLVLGVSGASALMLIVKGVVELA
ncbi:MAG TPA: sulfite exporter TauE/SafE family protein [Sphingomonas sp.]